MVCWWSTIPRLRYQQAMIITKKQVELKYQLGHFTVDKLVHHGLSNLVFHHPGPPAPRHPPSPPPHPEKIRLRHWQSNWHPGGGDVISDSLVKTHEASQKYHSIAREIMQGFTHRHDEHPIWASIEAIEVPPACNLNWFSYHTARRFYR